MANRNSATSVKSDDYINPVIEEAITVAPTAMQQLRSSGEAALTKRTAATLSKLEDAVAKEVRKDLEKSSAAGAGEVKNV
jgi:hypothetical protein